MLRSARATNGDWYTVTPGSTGADKINPATGAVLRHLGKDVIRTDNDRIAISDEYMAIYKYNGNTVFVIDIESGRVVVALSSEDWTYKSVFFVEEDVMVAVKTNSTKTLSKFQKKVLAGRAPLTEYAIERRVVNERPVVYIPHTRTALMFSNKTINGLDGYNKMNVDTGKFEGTVCVAKLDSIEPGFPILVTPTHLTIRSDRTNYVMDVKRNLLVEMSGGAGPISNFGVIYLPELMSEVVKEEVTPDMEWTRLHLNGKWTSSKSEWLEEFEYPTFKRQFFDNPAWARSIAAMKANLALPEGQRAKTVYELFNKQ